MPWRWRHYRPRKDRWTTTGLNDVTSSTVVHFIVAAIMTSPLWLERLPCLQKRLEMINSWMIWKIQSSKRMNCYLLTLSLCQKIKIKMKIIIIGRTAPFEPQPSLEDCARSVHSWELDHQVSTYLDFATIFIYKYNRANHYASRKKYIYTYSY
jgi:hypothetical protein